MFRPVKYLVSATRCSPVRWCSGFVSRMRYLNRLKQDDESCAAALQNAHILLFHRLSPLLQRTERGTLRPAALTTPDVQSVLERLGADGSLLKDSVLIGCSEQNQAQFCLDVGELDQAAVEEQCEGNFVALRKAFFLLTGPEAPLVAKVGNGFCVWSCSSLWVMSVSSLLRLRLCCAGIKPTVSAAPRVNQATGTRPGVRESAAAAASSTTPRCLRWPLSWCLMGNGVCWVDSPPSLQAYTAPWPVSVTWLLHDGLPRLGQPRPHPVGRGPHRAAGRSLVQSGGSSLCPEGEKSAQERPRPRPVASSQTRCRQPPHHRVGGAPTAWRRQSLTKKTVHQLRVDQVTSLLRNQLHLKKPPDKPNLRCGSGVWKLQLQIQQIP